MLDIVQSLDLVMQVVLYCTVQAGWLLPCLVLSELELPFDFGGPQPAIHPPCCRNLHTRLLPHLPSNECPFST